MSLGCSETAAFLETPGMSLILIIGIVVLGVAVAAAVVLFSSTKRGPED